MISVEQLGDLDFAEVSGFHSRAFGGSSYQSNPRYLQWLYANHPGNPDRSRGWIARDERREIVGCIHVMYLCGISSGTATRIHSLQNLIVDPELRGGLGMALVKRAMRGADLSVFPGVVGALADTYRAIRYEEVKTFWGRSITSPVRAGFGMALAKARIKRSLPAKLQSLLARSAEASAERDDILAERLSAREGNIVAWSPELVRWRFFSRNGPRHLVWYERREAERYCIVSVGIRHGVVAARLIEFGADVSFLAGVVGELKSSGIEMILAFGSPVAGRQTLSALGLQSLENPPVSFIKRNSPAHQAGPIELSGALTDVGFESIGVA